MGRWALSFTTCTLLNISSQTAATGREASPVWQHLQGGRDAVSSPAMSSLKSLRVVFGNLLQRSSSGSRPTMNHRSPRTKVVAAEIHYKTSCCRPEENSGTQHDGEHRLCQGVQSTHSQSVLPHVPAPSKQHDVISRGTTWASSDGKMESRHSTLILYLSTCFKRISPTVSCSCGSLLLQPRLVTAQILRTWSKSTNTIWPPYSTPMSKHITRLTVRVK